MHLLPTVLLAAEKPPASKGSAVEGRVLDVSSGRKVDSPAESEKPGGKAAVAEGSPADAHSPQNAEKSGQRPERDDGFAPGLAIFVLLVIVIGLVLLGAGAILTLVFIALVACLLGFGILTMSMLTGATSRRPRTAVKAFFLQLGGVAGACGGAGTAILAKWLSKSPISAWSATVAGGMVGLLAGIVLAALFNYAWDTLFQLLLNRMGNGHSPPPPQNGAG